MIARGTKVRCVDTGGFPQLKAGQDYEVYDNFLILKEMLGHGFYAHHFVEVNQAAVVDKSAQIVHYLKILQTQTNDRDVWLGVKDLIKELETK